MNIECEKTKTIFKHTKDGKDFYSIGLSKKKQDGTYENGYMSCKFKKDTKIEDKTKIKIVEAWIDFYVKDKITYPYIFINKFETIENINIPQNVKTEYQENSDIKLSDDDIDKVFGEQMELPF